MPSTIPSKPMPYVVVEASRPTEMPSMTGSVTPILVQDQILNIHTSVLTRSSEFLTTALRPEWRSDPSVPIDLSDEKIAIFETYLQWLYTQRIVFSGGVGPAFNHLATLYVLGEKLLDPTFQNTILTALIAFSKTHSKYPPDTAIKIIYDGTSTESPARRLLVDFWAYAGKPHWTKSDLSPAVSSTEFADELIQALLEVRLEPDGFIPRPWVAKPEGYRCVVRQQKGATAAGTK